MENSNTTVKTEKVATTPTASETTYSTGQTHIDAKASGEALNKRIEQMRKASVSTSTEPEKEVQSTEVKQQTENKAKAELDKKVETKVEESEPPESLEDLVNKTSKDKTEIKSDEKIDTRKEKSDERLDKTWKSVNDWKTRLAQREVKIDKDVEAKVAERMKEFEESRPDIVRLTPKAYEDMAKQAEESGNDELAETYRKQGKNVAKQLEVYAEKQKEYDQKLREYKQALWYEMRESYPDLKNPNSELAQEIVQFYSDEKVVNLIKKNPELERLAVQHADYKVKARKAEQLEAKVSELEAALKDANDKLSLSGAYEMKNAGSQEDVSSGNLSDRINKMRKRFV